MLVHNHPEREQNLRLATLWRKSEIGFACHYHPWLLLLPFKDLGWKGFVVFALVEQGRLVYLRKKVILTVACWANSIQALGCRTPTAQAQGPSLVWSGSSQCTLEFNPYWTSVRSLPNLCQSWNPFAWSLPSEVYHLVWGMRVREEHRFKRRHGKQILFTFFYHQP